MHCTGEPEQKILYFPCQSRYTEVESTCLGDTGMCFLRCLQFSRFLKVQENSLTRKKAEDLARVSIFCMVQQSATTISLSLLLLSLNEVQTPTWESTGGERGAQEKTLKISVSCVMLLRD